MNDIASPQSLSVEAIGVANRKNLRRVAQESTTVVAQSAAISGDPFIVLHDLGRVPERIYTVPWADSRVWATENDRRNWTEKQVILRASATATKIDVWVATLN